MIDFRANRYNACRVIDVIEHGAKRAELDRLGKMRSLGTMLGDEFLDCHVGSPRLVYDTGREKWDRDLGPSVKHVITTSVVIDPHRS